MKVAIHYFSGCGNSAWIAVNAQKCFQQAGHEVVLMQNAELAFPATMPTTELDLFIAPVYFGGLPANVVSYYKRLPLVAGRKALFWAVCGAKAGLSSWMSKSLLSERGYEVIATDTIQMPDTFLFLKMSQMTPEQRKEVLLKAKQKVSANIEALTNLPPQEKENLFILIFSGILYFLYFVVIRHSLGLMMTANSKCTHCGLCAQNCPVHCIHMKDEKPAWNTGCVNCFRCLNNCPVQAIDISEYALFAGLIGGLIGATVVGTVVPLGFISGFLGLFVGYFAGCFIYQHLRKSFPVDKGLLLEKKERVLITKEEKDL